MTCMVQGSLLSQAVAALRAGNGSRQRRKPVSGHSRCWSDTRYGRKQSERFPKRKVKSFSRPPGQIRALRSFGRFLSRVIAESRFSCLRRLIFSVIQSNDKAIQTFGRARLSGQFHKMSQHLPLLRIKIAFQRFICFRYLLICMFCLSADSRSTREGIDSSEK